MLARNLILTSLSLLALAGCNASSDNNTNTGSNTPPATPESIPVSTLKVAVLPDTQGGGQNTSIHPMRTLLNKYREQDVDVLLVVGDLSEEGTPAEYEQWLSVADDFRDDFVFLPL